MTVEIQPDTKQHVTINPIFGELVHGMTSAFSQQLVDIVRTQLAEKGISGIDIESMTGELTALRASVESLTKERDRLTREVRTRDERLEQSDAVLQSQDNKVRALQKLNSELAAHLQRIVYLYDELKAQSVGQKSRDTEHPQVMILSGPLSTIGMTPEEVADLRGRFSDDASFRKNLTRAAQTRVHPDVITAPLDNIHDPFLRNQIKVLQEERFKNIENAVDDIIEQLMRRGKVENKWHIKKPK